MKILLLCRALSTGGVERQIALLARGLAQRGDTVVVAVFYSGGALETELLGSGAEICDLRKGGRWDVFGFVFRFLRLVRRSRPDVVYGFLNTSNILSVTAKIANTKVRIVWGVRASDVDLSLYDWLHKVAYRIECWSARFADLIISNSQAGVEYAAANGFPRRKLIAIPNGIDTTRFKPDPAARKRVRAEWNVSDSQILIGLVARLDPIKGHRIFLRAAASLAELIPDVVFVCVGNGPREYKDELLTLSRMLKLESKLIWVGERHDIPDVLNAMDIATSASDSEGFSNTILEAMACGVPCVATKVGDTPFIVGALGELAPPRNAAEFSHAVMRLIGRLNPDLAAQNREAVGTRFGISSFIESTAEALCRRA